jgi:hypothetical protein
MTLIRYYDDISQIRKTLHKLQSEIKIDKLALSSIVKILSLNRGKKLQLMDDKHHGVVTPAYDLEGIRVKNRCPGPPRCPVCQKEQMELSNNKVSAAIEKLTHLLSARQEKMELAKHISHLLKGNFANEEGVVIKKLTNLSSQLVDETTSLTAETYKILSDQGKKLAPKDFKEIVQNLVYEIQGQFDYKDNIIKTSFYVVKSSNQQYYIAYLSCQNFRIDKKTTHDLFVTITRSSKNKISKNYIRTFSYKISPADLVKSNLGTEFDSTAKAMRIIINSLKVDFGVKETTRKLESIKPEQLIPVDYQKKLPGMILPSAREWKHFAPPVRVSPPKIFAPRVEIPVEKKILPESAKSVQDKLNQLKEDEEFKKKVMIFKIKRPGDTKFLYEVRKRDSEGLLKDIVTTQTTAKKAEAFCKKYKMDFERVNYKPDDSKILSAEHVLDSDIEGSYTDKDGYTVKVRAKSFPSEILTYPGEPEISAKSNSPSRAGVITIHHPNGKKVLSGFWMNYPEKSWKHNGTDLYKDLFKNGKKSIWHKLPLKLKLNMEAKQQSTYSPLKEQFIFKKQYFSKHAVFERNKHIFKQGFK